MGLIAEINSDIDDLNDMLQQYDNREEVLNGMDEDEIQSLNEFFNNCKGMTSVMKSMGFNSKNT